MNAIIYTTNTGSTEHYAKLLAQKTGLPVYSLAEAKKRVFAGAEVIYLGWIMAGSVKGYAEAAKRYQVRAVGGVGMGQTGTQTDLSLIHISAPCPIHRNRASSEAAACSVDECRACTPRRGASTVSYTHLDVYKRQIFLLPRYGRET